MLVAGWSASRSIDGRPLAVRANPVLPGWVEPWIATKLTRPPRDGVGVRAFSYARSWMRGESSRNSYS